MWIINKEKSQIYNMSAFSRLAISNGSSGKFLILAIIDSNNFEHGRIEMGGYATTQKAVSIIREIYKAVECGANVYEMPADEDEMACEKK